MGQQPDGFIETEEGIPSQAEQQSETQAQQLQRLEATLSGMADPVLVVNSLGHISLLNRAAEGVLAVEASTTIGCPATEALQSYPDLLRFLTGESAIAEDTIWEGPDGRFFSPRVAHVDSEGQRSTVLTLRDITAFRLINRRQTLLVDLITHDLRSPLTSLKLSADLVSISGPLNTRQEETIAKIYGIIDQMAALISNIKDVGRWDRQTGAYQMNRELTDLTQIASEVAANYRDMAAKQNVTLLVTTAPNVPIVNVDSLMIQRALVNLVSNAIKYSPYGGTAEITVQVENDAVLVCVSDTGLGIAPEDFDKLFDVGQRIITSEVKKNKIKGSGLGLFIVRSVARWHGGDAWIESELGKGSRFFFSIPLRDANLIGGQ